MTNRFSPQLEEYSNTRSGILIIRSPETLSEKRSVVSTQDQLLEVAYEASFYNDLFSDPSYVCLCAFEHEKNWSTDEVSIQDVSKLEGGGEVLVGVASARSFENAKLLGDLSGTLCNARTGYILTLCVLPRCRRKGIARLLLEQLCDKLQHSHFCSRVSLHTLAKNIAAQSLYTSLGFTRVSYLANHYYFLNHFHDAVYMRKTLTPLPFHAVVTDSCIRGAGVVNNTFSYLLSPLSSLFNGISREVVDSIPNNIKEMFASPIVIDVYRNSSRDNTDNFNNNNHHHHHQQQQQQQQQQQEQQEQSVVITDMT
jgi:ribosomal protein S18 acetylase RimI-like enzyme